MIREIKITYTSGVPGGRGLPRARYNRMRREALIDVGNFWHEHYREGHFTVQGAAKYGYTPRSGVGTSGKSFWRSYSGRKQKYLGHQRPLMFTGKSEERTRVRLFTVRAAGDRATLRIRLNAPGLNRRNPRSQIDMRREMTSVTPDELDAMARVYAGGESADAPGIIGRIQHFAGRETVTITA